MVEVVTIFWMFMVTLILYVEILYECTCDEYSNANTSLQVGLSI